jgi:GH25 family lysozyme M1 (1,4-beta-N-acetylmuramidase)
MKALNRAPRYRRPPTSSAAGRFNVGEPHSLQLLRELSGPLGRPGSQGAPAKNPGQGAVPSGSAPATPAPGTPATAAPVPSPAASANTTGLTTLIRPAAAAATTATMPQGIDVASFQHPGGAAINWTQVAGAGDTFAAVKATEGNYYTNPYYASDITAARAAGLYVTGYHFAIPNVGNAVDQADYAVENGSYAGDGDTLPLELDVEYDPYASSDHTNTCYELTPSQMVSWIRAFDGEVQRVTGQLPIIYTAAGWWSTCTGNSSAFGSDQLWIAAYSVSIPVLPAGWPAWMFWQHTSTGTVPGIAGDTDLSYFDSDQADLTYPGIQHDAAGAAVSVQVNSLNTAAGQALSFTASGLPAGLSISGTGLISGTVSAPAGAYKVVVTATDPSGATGSAGFLWEVPGTVTVTSPGNQSTTIGSAVSVPVLASDTATGYVPSFTAAGLPPGVSMSSTGRITGWPDAAGTYNVTVTATDGLNVSGSAAFTWTVTTAPAQGPAGRVWLQNGGKCLDDTAGRTASGTRVQVWGCNGNANQQWMVVPDGTLRVHGACLAAAGTGTGAGNGAAAVLNACHGTSAQRWQVGTNGELVAVASGRCLDDTGWRTANGTLLQIWACSGGSEQHWIPAAAAMVSGIPGKCADDPGFRTANGRRLDVWACAGSSNERWTAEPDGSIRVSGKCLDVAGYGTASGTALDLYTCRGTTNQRWKIVPEGPLGSEVVNPASGKCLADAGDATANGSKLTIQACQAQDPGDIWHVM